MCDVFKIEQKLKYVMKVKTIVLTWGVELFSWDSPRWHNFLSVIR